MELFWLGYVVGVLGMMALELLHQYLEKSAHNNKEKQ